MLSIDEIIATVKQLSKPDKVRLITELVTDLAATTNSNPAASQPTAPTPAPSVRDILARLGPNPTPDEIEAVRQALQTATAANPIRPIGSLYGIWTHYGVSVSEEEIAEARREMLAGFAEGDDW